MNTKVIYVSATGNTASVAREIFKALPSSSKDIQELNYVMDRDNTDCYFIGFWVNRGSANMEVLNFLSELHGKKVAFFGTCGMGNSPEYYADIEQRVLAFLPEDNEYFGNFFCQGKMPIRVRRKYEQMQSSDRQDIAQRLIQNFDEALFHPSREDFEKASLFAKTTYKKMLKEAPLS